MTSAEPAASNLSTFAGSWILDPARTKIEFHTKAMWVLKVKGTAKATEGRGTVGPDGSLDGVLVVDAGSIDTGNKKRDGHLRTADFFQTDQHPTITYTATGARPGPTGKAEVTGTLTVHGETRPLTLLVDIDATPVAATVSTEVTIDRSEWGLTWAKLGAGLSNRVVVSAHFKKA
jgi:polyisoprenoid-binding protein YceI